MKRDLNDERIMRIRNRASYKLFQQLYDFLYNNPSVVDILKKIYDVLDAKRSFGSRQNAEYAAESLDLVLKDNGEMNEAGLKWQRKNNLQLCR